MKKVMMIAAVAGLAMVSCKKDRTCKCTDNLTGLTVNGTAVTGVSGSSSTETKMTKVSKTSAQVECNSGTQTITETDDGDVYVWTMTRDCSLS